MSLGGADSTSRDSDRDDEDSPQQATGYQKEDDPEPARSKLRGIAPKEIEFKMVNSGRFLDHTAQRESRNIL
jgi:hypothetical protein